MLRMSLWSIPFHVSQGSYILHLKIETLCISYYMYIEKSVICGKLGYKSSHTTLLDFFVLCHFHITFHLLNTSEIEQKRLNKNVFLTHLMGRLITLYTTHTEPFLALRFLYDVIKADKIFYKLLN